MDLTPPSSQDPTSPSRYLSGSQTLYEYPSPAQSYKSAQFLLRYPMSATENNNNPITANNWHVGPHQPHDTPRACHHTPNLLTAGYEQFASLQSAGPAAYAHDMYPVQSAEVSVLPSSPGLTDSVSHRSSLSSAHPSDGFAQPRPTYAYTPRIKVEEHPEYGPEHVQMLTSSSDLSEGLHVTTAPPYPGTLESVYYPNPTMSVWPKVEYRNAQDLPSISSLPFPQRPESQIHRSAPSQRRGPRSVPRTRLPRKLTTKEDANFQCGVKGCGKLFGRSYNFKAHMETHDVGRDYPFPCPIKDCNKKFVRKTDLQRHHQSVHMKQRNYRCDYCSRYFARKDTLRRHMEDGCSKRFDIETVDFRPQSYGVGDQLSWKGRPSEPQSRHGSHSSSTPYTPPPNDQAESLQHERSLTSEPGHFLERQHFMAAPHDHTAMWLQ